MKKEAADREEAEKEYKCFMDDFEAYENEWDRRCLINSKRRGMPCFFNDGLTSSDFIEIAERAGRKIKRIKSVSVRGAEKEKVTGTIKAQLKKEKVTGTIKA